MTYAISLVLMTAGLVLLTWTLIAALRLKRTETEVSFSGITPAFFDHEPHLEAETEVASGRRTNPAMADWYQLQHSGSRGVRYAPDMGGFTEVPLQLHDAYDNRMYVRKRIWMN